LMGRGVDKVSISYSLVEKAQNLSSRLFATCLFVGHDTVGGG
jgi:hypothetical protein